MHVIESWGEYTNEEIKVRRVARNATLLIFRSVFDI